MIWILFAVLFVLGAAGIMLIMFNKSIVEKVKKKIVFKTSSSILLLAGLAGLIVFNWRIAIVLLFAGLSTFIVLMAIDEEENMWYFVLVFTIIPTLGAGFAATSSEVNSKYSDYAYESEIELVSLGDELTVDLTGQGTRRYVYVQSEAENSYTYRYETTSDIDGSKVYKKAVVSGNVEEKEVDECNTPVLKTYVRHRIALNKNFYTGKIKEVEKEEDRLYVFVVPTGSIQKTINLK